MIDENNETATEESLDVVTSGYGRSHEGTPQSSLGSSFTLGDLRADGTFVQETPQDAPGAIPEPPDEESTGPTLEDRVAALEDALSRASAKERQYEEDMTSLRRSRETIRRLEEKVARTKEAAASAKKELDVAYEDHLSLEDRIDSGQGRLPFGDEEATVMASEDGSGGHDLPNLLPDVPPDPDAEDWRVLSVSNLDLTIGLERALHDAGLGTIGDLADWTNAGKDLRDVPGVGKAKAERIAEALRQFWAARSEQQPGVDVVSGSGVTSAAAVDAETGLQIVALRRVLTPAANDRLDAVLDAVDVDVELAAGCAEVEAARADASERVAAVAVAT